MSGRYRSSAVETVGDVYELYNTAQLEWSRAQYPSRFCPAASRPGWKRAYLMYTILVRLCSAAYALLIAGVDRSIAIPYAEAIWRRISDRLEAWLQEALR